MKTQLLSSLTSLRKEVVAITYDVGTVACRRSHDNSILNHYESIIVYPTYDVSHASPSVQSAYDNYGQAIAIVTSSNRDLYQNCLDWLAKGSPQEYISSLTWMTARQGVDQALQLIIPAINLLESE